MTLGRHVVLSYPDRKSRYLLRSQSLVDLAIDCHDEDSTLVYGTQLSLAELVLGSQKLP